MYLAELTGGWAQCSSPTTQWKQKCFCFPPTILWSKISLPLPVQPWLGLTEFFWFYISSTISQNICAAFKHLLSELLKKQKSKKKKKKPPLTQPRYAQITVIKKTLPFVSERRSLCSHCRQNNWTITFNTVYKDMKTNMALIRDNP